MWCQLSAWNGNKHAQGALGSLASELVLSSKQVNKAKELARDWKAKPKPIY
jgi:hypothetical protein